MARLRPLMRAVTLGIAQDDNWVVVDVKGVHLVKRNSTTVLRSLEHPTSVARVSADGSLLAIATYKQVSLFSIPALKRLWTVDSVLFESRGFAFVDEAVWHLARTGCERLALAKGKQLEKVGPAARLLDVSADGKTWLGHGKTAGTMSVGPAGKKRVEFPARTACLLPDSRVLAADGGPGALGLALLDLHGKPLVTGKGPRVGYPAHLVASPSGRFAVLTGERVFVVVDTATLQTKTIAAPNSQLAAFTDDDATLLMATRTFTSRKR